MREDTILSEYTGTSFFNSIGMIDVERLHSSMIRWILSDDCGAFSQNTKGEILSEIFKINNKGLPISRSQTEWKNMDIIFETSNGEVWIIENKIKCELHDNQLAKYSDIILNEKLEFSGDETSAHFAYLTLLPMKDQTAVCKNKKIAIWKNITHGDIAETLSNASYDGQNELDKNIVQAYAKALSELAQNAKNALNYPKMLFEPRKCKVPKDIASYIEKYNLRNILRKHPVRYICHRLNLDRNFVPKF